MKQKACKRILGGFFILCLWICSCPMSAKAVTKTSSDNKWQYTILDAEEKTVEITATDYTSGTVSIPSTIDGYSVKRLGANVFNGKSNITSVTIGEGIEYIGESCFRKTGITSITIPSSVKTVGKSAFYQCTSLKTVIMEEGVTTLETLAFCGCKILTNITIPSTLQDYYMGVFWNTKWLINKRNAAKNKLVIENGILIDGRMATGNIVVPKGVHKIASSAFYAPSDLTADASASTITGIVILNNVEEMGYRVFNKCTQLKRVTLPKELKAMGTNCFNGCTSLQEIVLPNTLQTIEKGTFDGCTSLERLVLSENLISVGENGIPDYEGLVIEVPKGMTDIAVLNVTGFQNVALRVVEGGEVEDYLKENQFANYTTYKASQDGNWQYEIIDGNNKTIEIVGLSQSVFFSENVTIPGTIDGYTVSGVGQDVFRNNKTLTAVSFGIGVEYIGDYCFLGCNYLGSVTLPNTLHSIGVSAFNSCSSLETIEIPDTVFEIREGAFWYTPWLNAAREEREDHLVIRNGILIDGRLATGDVVIPGTVTSIANNACYGPDSILEETSAATTIKGASMTSLTIPSSVETIGEVAFYYCNHLETLRIGEGLTTLKRECFSHCTSLTDVTIPSTLVDFGGGVFWYTTWLDEMRSEAPDKLVVVNNILVDGVLATDDVVIPDGISEILPCAFYAPASKTATVLSSSTMTSLRIPEGVKKIGFRAFVGCTNLKQATLPETLVSLGNNCFNGCTSLEEMIIPNRIDTIGKGTFESCTGLKRLVLSENIKSIGENGISDTEGLVIEIPEGLTDIAFLNVEDFRNIVLHVVEGGVVEAYLKENHFTNYTTYAPSNPNPPTTSEDPTPEDPAPETPTPEEPTMEQPTTAEPKDTEGGTVETPATTENPDNQNPQTTETPVEVETPQVVDGCTYTVLENQQVSFSAPKKISQKSLTIPSSVKVGGVSYKVTKIEAGACKGMENLKTVTIGDSVVTVGKQAFMNCKNLQKVQIGKKVTSIGSKAFYGDKNVKTVVIKSKKLKKIGKKAFSGIPKSATFRVPKGKGNDYKKLIKKAR